MLAIKVENLSKQYRLGQIGTGTLSHDLNRFWAKLRGKEDPYARIGAANDRTQKADSDYVWALKDINFEIEQGDAVGIIGRNGAGKSTLLKILSRTTLPTTGSIKMKGRIASLLEVGTGFHPEMTGRENIYQNGAILGMSRHEITRKFDEIVDFSGCEAYIDTPVKRYSSGMYVRLAFAVAAHLESEILIVDEVLAVGDAEFQKKCLGKLGEVSKGQGRTVLFVSHDLSAVSSLTRKAILLSDGKLVEFENTDKVIRTYSSKLSKDSIFYPESTEGASPFIRKVELITSELNSLQGCTQQFQIVMNIIVNNYIEGLTIAVQIINKYNRPVTFNWKMDSISPFCRTKGNYELTLSFKNLRLYKGDYYLRIHLAESIHKKKFQEFECLPFEIDMINLSAPEWGWQNEVCQYIEDAEWDIVEI